METYTYHYPKPSVTTDCIIINEDKVLLIKRLKDPFEGKWALPGGFVEIDEDLPDGATRELEEETGLANIALAQFATYGLPGRDPRGRTISVVYAGSISGDAPPLVPGDDATEARWFPLAELPPLAFDHDTIIQDYLRQSNK